jgi:hypothetical protein
LQPHEIDAQVAGFKRLSKIRKQPFEKIVRELRTEIPQTNPFMNEIYISPEFVEAYERETGKTGTRPG